MAAQLAAAAAAVLPLIKGPALPGAVIGSFTDAIIIGVPTTDGSRVVSLLTRRAAGVANGLRVATSDALPHIATGTTALVGAGRVLLDGLEVQVVRQWNSRVPVIRPVPAQVAALSMAAGRAERGVPDGAVAALRVALRNRGPHSTFAVDPAGALEQATDGLVGLGRGLTPGGDDVIAGLLTALHAVELRGVIAVVRSRLQDLTDRTTTVSADLLRLAADGHACSEALALLRAMGRTGSAPDGRVPAAAAFGRLLSVGHTSGADLATGMAVGFEFAMSPQGRAALARPGVAENAVVR